MESNLWLAVIAVATAVQSLMLVVIAIGAFRIYRVATTAAERLERQTLAPLVQRTQEAADRFERLVGRIEDADDQVRQTVAHTTQRFSQAAAFVRTRLWPVLGVGRGAVAAIAAFTSRRAPRAPRGPSLRPGRERPLIEDETRFVYEGGIDHARS